MAEAQRSISPNTKELRVRLKRLKLDQQFNDSSGNISDDEEDEGSVGLKKPDNTGKQVQGACAMDNSCANNSPEDCLRSDVAGASAMLVDEVQTLAFPADFSEDEFVIDEIVKDLPTILSLPPFDPYAPVPQTDIVFKPVVSLMQLSLREDNVIEVEELDAEISMKLLCEYSKSVIRTAEGQLRPITDLADIFVKHDKDEFYTFCSCKECLEYRETIMSIMMDQFKAAHMVVMLLDVFIKAYSPMLKNDSAYNKFEKLLESNKEIYWITSGYLYDKNADYLDFIDDSTISDNMILVLFSSILMVNNPMLLLQILAYNVECIVKAFSEGIIEIAQPKNGKIPAAKMLTYVLEGYSDLNCISQKISLNLFAFENDFLRRFKLTWVLLCQRLFQQHVYTHLADTMLACIITLKEDVLTQQNSSLIKRYILFDEHMNSIERRWGDIWVELNKFNTSEVEHMRRTGLLDVHNIFDTVVMDATSFSLPDISDDEFTDFQRIEDRHLAWRNIMAFTKLKWPDGFYDPPNTLVYEDRCSKCSILLEYHLENCKCVTCSIAGGPLAPIAAVASGTCAKCATHAIVEKNPKIKKSKILSTCTSDDSSSIAKISAVRKSIALEEFNDEMSTVVIKRNENETLRTTYHIAWAVFQHLTTRKRYRFDSIEPQNFCNESCRVSACLLARKILNNEIAPLWTQVLVRYFQPLSFSREELRATLPSIMFFNRKMHPCNVELREQQAHNYILKTYWTFILSIYANFFMKFNFPSITDFTNLEIVNKDLRLRLRNIVGDDNDMSFESFLGHAKRLSPFRSTDDLALLDAHIDQMQKGLDKLMSIHEAQIIKHPRHDASVKPKVQDASSSTTPNISSNDNGAKKPCKEKMRKCCLEYSDIGEHCKENHTKKRVKKECNHARYNETRDRLRKKFAQIVNERKNKNTAAEPKVSTSEAVAKTTVTQPVQAAAPPTKEPPSLKSVATAAAGFKTTNDRFKVASENSLSCLDSLCKRIQLGKPINCPKEFKEAAKVSTAQLEAARAQIRAKEKDIEKMVASLHLSNSIGVVNEFYEFLDNYTKEQDKKWINEALNFIEGNDKPQQPQTTNPKKAAKKLKQKLRKEEEKRIGELHDLRGQFHDIYFKEFSAKQELKTQMASSKKRDKKRISELEINIKKLQRAKAKVETGILELIATVKQTNGEFKFTYLPTKEQQQQKMRNKTDDEASNAPHAAANVVDTEINTKCNSETLSATMINNHMPHLQQFINYPKHKQLFSPLTMQTPMCYAPPQQQQLPPDVVAAMAANAVTADPAKRIVTIRRVNMPNANEPQVTVTAKGRSPDEDKLLYTFVNGQLVPSAISAKTSLNDLDAYKNLRLPSVNKAQNKKDLKRSTAANGLTNANVTVPNVLEHKLDKLHSNCPNEKLDQAHDKKPKKLKSKAKANKLTMKNSNESSAKESASSTATCSNSTSKSETPLSSAVNTRENSVCSLKPTNNAKVQAKPNKKTHKTQVKPEKSAPVKQNIKPTPEIKTILKVKAKSHERESQPQGEDKIKEKREKRSKLIDSGQFDNNPFKTLQDSSDSEWESGSETLEIPCNSSPEAATPIVKPTVIEKSAKPSAAVGKKEVATSNLSTNKKKEMKEAVPTIAPPLVRKGKLDGVKQQQPQIQTQKPVTNNKNQTNTKQPNAQQAPPTTLPCSRRQQESTATRTRSGKQQQKQAPSTSPAVSKQQPQQRTRNSNRAQPQSSSSAHTLDAGIVTEQIAPPASSKRSQRSKRYQKQKQDCMSGIPNNMGYFNPNEVAIPPAQQQLSSQQLQANYNTHICQKLQNLRINNSNAPAQTFGGKLLPSNVSIMDQLNRGVQVEDLSLPPGITLTKVDPVKSEQLRQKSESIRKIAKPLQATHQVTPTANPFVSRMFQQSQQAATIIPSGTNYYGGSYGGDASGIIMVEANPKANGQQQPSVAAAAAAAAANGKSTSRRRRRNKTKSGGGTSNSSKPRDNVPDVNGCGGSATKMVTLRNPMFHGDVGSSGVTPGASVIQQQPPMLPGRSYGGVPISATLPMDQPAAIIKNDNGMFTIRNPVLHQAVTNGLALSGYRQFGNVNYYTPQEAVAEASRATQNQPPRDQLNASELTSNNGGTPTSFSYFSSGMANVVSTDRTNSMHNNISISCTNVNGAATNCSSVNDNSAGRRLIGEAAIIARPNKPNQQKCISAIGSEIKQKTKESGQHWSSFGQDFSAPEFNNPAVLQEKYQQSNYYNGFDVFPTVQNTSSSGTGSLFDPADCHIQHHSCGDDSPPPTITGFNSYLEGIPNTGVIRYDDASFLKNLIPGQQLNNEVSIHNISDSNYVRSTASPAPHHVEMTTVYGGRPQSTNSFEQPPQTNSNPGANYCEQATDYGNDSQLYSQTNLLTGMPELDVRERYNYDFEPPTVSTSSSTSATADSQQQGIIDLNELLRRSPHSQRTSPYNIDENVALETFVQNMNALQIAAAAAGTTNDAEQCSHLNGTGVGSEANPSASGAEGATASAANGWW